MKKLLFLTALLASSTVMKTHTTGIVTSAIDSSMTTLSEQMQKYPRFAALILASCALYKVEEYLSYREKMKRLDGYAGKQITADNIKDIKNTTFDFNIPLNPLRWPGRALKALVALLSNRTR